MLNYTVNEVGVIMLNELVLFRHAEPLIEVFVNYFKFSLTRYSILSSSSPQPPSPRSSSSSYCGLFYWGTEGFNPRLAKRPLETNGRLVSRGLTSLVKEATVWSVW